MTWGEDPEKFQAWIGRLKYSLPSVQEAAMWLLYMKHKYNLKYEIEIPETTFSKSVEDNPNHSDNGDIILHFPDGSRLVVEVKQISRNFTCRQDWPFGDRAMVDRCATFDKKDPVPWRYICWSHDKRSLFVLNVKRTRHKWWIESTFNTQEQKYQPFYYVNKNYCKFYKWNPRYEHTHR